MIGRLKGYIFCAAILIVRCSVSLGTGSPTFTSTPRGFDSRTATKRLGGSAWGQQRDRKSTRLNSSHSQISYAVFCLKKKKYHVEQLPVVHPAHIFLLGHLCMLLTLVIAAPLIRVIYALPPFLPSISPRHRLSLDSSA